MLHHLFKVLQPPFNLLRAAILIVLLHAFLLVVQNFFFIRVLFLSYYVQLREKSLFEVVEAHAIIWHACFFPLRCTLCQCFVTLSIAVIAEQVGMVHVEEYILCTELKPADYL